MRVRSVAPLAIVAIVATGSLVPADAATKKKPIKKTYTLTLASMPDASEETACSGAARLDGVNMDVETIKVTGPGVLTVKVTKFVSDWDMSLYNTAGSMLTEGAGTSTPNTSTAEQTESLKYKSKKAQTFNLRVCNFIGSPTATVSYTYVYS